MVSHFLDVFDVAEPVLSVQNENCPAFNAQVGDQRAIALAEGAGSVIRYHVHAIDSEVSAPTLLRERQIHTDGVNLNAGKLSRFIFEALGLSVADRSIEGRHDAENSNAVSCFSEIDFLKGIVDRLEVGRNIAGLELWSY